MPVAEVNGVKINYLQIGPESGGHCQDLVMVHGLATNLAFWYLPHALEFSKYYRVTVYDLRGHGRSGITESGYTPYNMSVDLLYLLDHLGIRHAHFIAHSYGGNITLNLAFRHPDRFRSLILVDTHLSVRRLLKAQEWEFGQKIQPILDDHRLDVDTRDPYFGFKLISEIARMQSRSIEVAPELMALVSPFIGNFNNRTARQWLNLMETTKAEKELMIDDGLSPENLAKLDFPVLAMYGEHSQAMPSGEQLLEVWSHADFCRIRDVGHFFPVTRPSEFIVNCRQFWKNGSVFNLSPRKGDSGRRYFRSNRFYCQQGKWFFDTRESSGKGPFESLADAKAQLESKAIFEIRGSQRI